ncbi:hypothetical protein [Zongyangia hominis]|uniref:Uncharacterized protein n=1 Tax=Zongyangia hominis TaxID=2763677 RepID=A0A926IBJ2_9FIRM|nr:hypothetical protein [Zongyangia hominis]MBC8570150.1 hypothetical protein [Zongyangia hominis]
MDQVIARLLEVDKEAAKLVDDAKEELEKIKEAMEGEKLQFKQAYIERAKRRIQLLEKEENEHMDKASAELAEYYNKRQQQLQETYDERHEAWEQTIFDRCLAK